MVTLVLGCLGAVTGASSSFAGELVFSDLRCEQGPCLQSIWKSTDDGAVQTRLSVDPMPDHGARDWMPSWSPDGSSVVFARFGKPSGLYVADARGAESERLLVDDEGSGGGGFPDWSPRGDTIAFESIRSEAGGLPDSATALPFGVKDTDIFLVDADGSNLRRIVNGPGREHYPRFSQDGARVIFEKEGAGPGGLVGEADDTGWYSVALDGSDERRLTVGLPPMPEYSPDGNYLAFVTRWQELYTMRADGSDIRRWPGGVPYGYGIGWSPVGPSLFYGSYTGRTSIIHRAVVSAPDLPPIAITKGEQVDWAGGSSALPGPDGLPPATVVLGAQQRPIAIAPQGRSAAARIARASKKVPSVPLRKLHFFAVDATGVRRVDAALGRVGRRGRCRFLGARGFSRLRSCKRPL